MLTKDGWTDEAIFLPLDIIGKICNCGEIPKELITDNGIPLYRVGTIGKEATEFISNETFETYKNKYPYPKKGDILITTAGTIGKLLVFNGEPSYFQGGKIKWLDNDEKIVLNKYLYYLYSEIRWQDWDECQGNISHLSKEIMNKTEIPCPSFEVQRKIIEKLDKFEALLYDELSSIQVEINKRKTQYEYYRDNLLTFEESKVQKLSIKNTSDLPLFAEAI